MASAGGDMRLLWPDGCVGVEDVPNDLVRTVEHAVRVNTWHDNLTSQDLPPAWMWPFEDELSTWFERVEAERKERYGGGTDEGVQEAPMMQNVWRPEDDE